MKDLDLTFQPVQDPCVFQQPRPITLALQAKAAVTATGSSIVQRCSFLPRDLVS